MFVAEPAADPPAVVAPADPPATTPSPPIVVLRVETRSDVLASRDTPLPLAKAGRTEDALLRQAVFVTVTLTLTRPAAAMATDATTDTGAAIEVEGASEAAPAAGQDVLRWAYASYLHRQICFTSITGLFACAAAEVEPLPEKSEGETRVTDAPTADAPNPAAEAARIDLATTLRARAPVLFDNDRRLRLTPMLRAAGVVQPAKR